MQSARRRSRSRHAAARRCSTRRSATRSKAPDKPFLDVWFADENNGYAVGAYNLIFRPPTAAQTWEPWFDRTDNPKLLNLLRDRPVGDDLYIAGEGGLVLRLDAGAQRFVALADALRRQLLRRRRRARRRRRCTACAATRTAAPTAAATWSKVDAGLPATIVAAIGTADGAIAARRRRRSRGDRAAPTAAARSSRRARAAHAARRASPTRATAASRSSGPRGVAIAATAAR